MSIKNIGTNKWEVCVDVGRDPRTGKRKQVRKVINGNKKDAQIFESDTVANSKRILRTDRSLTVREFLLHKWLPAQTNLSDRTIYEYRKFSEMACRVIGEARMSDLTPLMLESALAEFKAPGTRRNIHRTLRAAFNYGVRVQYLSENPIVFVAVPKVPKKNGVQIYTPDEVKALLELVHGTSIEVGVILMLFAGMRASEACAVDWSDLDLESVPARVSIAKAYSSKSEQRIVETKTASSVGTNPLSSWAAQRLLELAQKRDLSAAPMTTAAGTRFSTEHFSRYFKKLIDSQDAIPYYPVKNLRHTCATIMLSQGTDIAVVSKFLRHSSIATTANFYLSALESFKNDAASKLDEAFAPQ
ncbi:MAG: site-specific integrase [Coriobacteriia bacterium]|nr:site-specific integrase [Coriobacteriia bacterium]